MNLKRSILFMSMAALFCSIFFLSSCSKDDDPVTTAPEEKKQLILTATSVAILKGDEVTFEVKVEGEPVDATIFIDSQEIAGGTYTFQETGSYTVIAKNALYKDSETLSINVNEMGNEGDVDVYISGSGRNANNNLVAKYWKNGVEQELDIEWPIGANAARSIFVDNGDVYIGGSSVAPGGNGISSATIWKNGEQIYWGDGIVKSGIQEVYVYNGNVYAVGSRRQSDPLKDRAVYWENGEMHELGTSGIHSLGQSIRVNENGIHIVYQESAPISSVKYWHNGTTYEMEDSYSDGSLFLDNNDVYICARSGTASGYKAKYWKNGTGHYISDGNSTMMASNIFVSNNDVHISGHEIISPNNEALYWKNGELTRLSSDQQHGMATGIFVVDNDVYISGNETNTGLKQQAVLWKNGEKISITDGITSAASATGIFVVKK